MRRTSLLVFLAACGGGGGDGPDGPPPIDARDVGDAAVATCTPKNGATVALEDVATGLDQPLLVTSAPGDGRLFVIEQTGAIRVIKDGQLLPTPFLDLGGADGVVQCCSEQGLLGIAFHPDFRQNDRFYVHHTARTTGDHVIAEYKAVFGTDTADPASRREILRFTDPYGNHNAGSLEFGPDRMLYIAFGDGGSGGDPQDRAQDMTSLFGKILRVDVDQRTGSKEYGIPTDNPYASSADGTGDPRPEIWHYGLRNPFRFTFDPANGNIYIGDVGQGVWEEIDVSPNLPDLNWGWDDREGAHCYEPTTACETANRVEPVVEFNHSQGWQSVMGGAVYRGPCFPDLVGTYFYGDHYAQGLWAFEYANGAAQNNRMILPNVSGITSVHPDATGEMYVTTINGNVRRIIVP
ncbi:MAG TPA: PQQ-dependent sugar dehydrogenase [Kofleriaceae bacterium]|nr:PQQ-dependent sugar dehydrogenase [Kofleriaceae bacterium]